MIKFKLFGIKIKLNILLLPVLIFSLFFSYYKEFLMTLAIVTLHELAHCKVSQHYFIKISEIELFPFGGVVKMNDELGLDPIKEIFISIAGPLANGIMFLTGYLLGQLLPIKEDILAIFLTANFIIAIFNLLPIIPLDGGRILRATISYVWGMKKATIMTVFIGKVLASVLFCVGIYYTRQSSDYLYIILLAIFLYFNVLREEKMVFFLFIKDVLRKKKTLQNNGIMNTKYLTVMESVNLNKVFQEFSTGKYHFVTVIDKKGGILGTLTESQILDAVGEHGNHITIGILVNLIKLK